MIVLNDDVNFKQLSEKVSRKVLSHGESLMLVEIYFKKGGEGEVHSHEEYEQISYIKSGSFEVTVGDEKRVLKEGDSFYADKNVKHGLVALEDSVVLDIFTPLRKEFLE